MPNQVWENVFIPVLILKLSLLDSVSLKYNEYLFWHEEWIEERKIADLPNFIV